MEENRSRSELQVAKATRQLVWRFHDFDLQDQVRPNVAQSNVWKDIYIGASTHGLLACMALYEIDRPAEAAGRLLRNYAEHFGTNSRTKGDVRLSVYNINAAPETCTSPESAVVPVLYFASHRLRVYSAPP